MTVVYKKLLKKLEINLIKYILLISFIVIITIILVTYKIQMQRVDDYKQEISSTVNSTFKFTEINTITRLSTTLKRILNNQTAMDYFRNKNREKLYLEVNNDYKLARENNKYINVLHFHNADGTSFLRIHKPNQHSDNIASKRAMIQQIHKEHKRLIGYESGVYGTVFRIIEPIFYDSKYIGALEIGVDPSFLLNDIKNILDEEGFFFINKEELKTYTNTYTFELNGMVIEQVVDKDQLDILNTIPKDYNFKKQITIKNLYKTYCIDPISIHDFKGKSPVVLLFYKDITQFMNTQKGANSVIFILLLIIILSLYFLAKKYVAYFEKTLNSFFTNIINTQIDKKNYLKAIEDSSLDFSVTVDKETFFSLNKAALKFFNFKNLNDLLKEHKCICDFFISQKDYIQKDMNGITWLEYLIQNNTLPNKVIMQKDNQNYIFLIKAESFTFKNKERFLIRFTDITELVQLQEEFEYIIKRNSIAKKGANIALWDWNLTNDKVYYSSIWKSLLGYKEDEIGDDIDQWHQRIHPDDVDKVISDLDAHLDGKNTNFISQHRLLHKSGKYIQTLCKGQALFEEGQPIRMVGIYSDITQEQKALEKIKEQEEMMIAQSRHAAMGEMISMIAHQWRQPIASIAMGVNNILLDIELDSINKDDLQLECNEIIDQTKHLSTTIDDFRDFFKEDKQAVVVSIESVIEDALKLMSKSLENNNIVVYKEYFHTEKIKTLPREILQILINLIKNAKEVLVEKEVQNKQIKIYTTEDTQNIYIDIKDNGGGVKKENINKVFQPYFTTKDEHNGTGLGLYMSQTLARKHLHGDLTIKNSIHGAILTLTIKK